MSMTLYSTAKSPLTPPSARAFETQLPKSPFPVIPTPSTLRRINSGRILKRSLAKKFLSLSRGRGLSDRQWTIGQKLQIGGETL